MTKQLLLTLRCEVCGATAWTDADEEEQVNAVTGQMMGWLVQIHDVDNLRWKGGSSECQHDDFEVMQSEVVK
jgi:hypothetical protein